MKQQQPSDRVARLPLPGDNVAIATRRLPAGTRIQYRDQLLTLDRTVLEGHRFTVAPIGIGAPLLSWELPFGLALVDLAPGTAIYNDGMLEALRGRRLEHSLPARPNFADYVPAYSLDETHFRPAEQVSLCENPRTFMGYYRSPSRGTGTRNFIVLLGTTSRAAAYVRQLEARLAPLAGDYPNISGIVAVAHTEGEHQPLNNRDLLLRTLTGFMLHPNVGAVLAVDAGDGAVNNAALRSFAEAHPYSLHEVLHCFFSLQGHFLDDLARGEAIVRGWLETVNGFRRTSQPLADLKVALQCGGSDAFSGISGNPLAAWVAREIIRHGGAANLAETDELIGAEPYMMQKVKDVETARRFLETLDRFQELAARHGASAEGNPSGGNKYRGLYNIVLKSIGAAMKRHPEVRLDAVIDYAEPLPGPGFTFMDSPGNDLESIAGQVASGCNLIFFITGNGSITNFPFVPTIKIVTTTRRYQMLAQEMDVNAGAYLDGQPMDTLGVETFQLALDVASGKLTAGERAGHSQVQIWRNWQQTGGSRDPLSVSRKPSSLTNRPYSLDSGPTAENGFRLTVHGSRLTNRIGLILPTSLCAGQIARMAAERLNEQGLADLARVVALVHTEGCGVSSGPSEALYVQTLLGYLSHPLVGRALFLEHGCEKTHNDYMRQQVEALGLDPDDYGWASIQLDGGIGPVLDRIDEWFQSPTHPSTLPLPHLSLGLLADGPLPEEAAVALASLTRAIAGHGGTVVVPENNPLLQSRDYLAETLAERTPVPTIDFAHPAAAPGLHIMATPTGQWTEILSGLGATGILAALVHVGQHPLPGHPLVPLLQVSASASVQQASAEDLDLCLEGDPADWPAQLLDLIADLLAGRYVPRLFSQGYVDFQIARGPLGISL